MKFTITEEWLDEHGVDIDDFMNAMEAAGYNRDPEDGAWVFTADDDNSDGIPDFLAGLISDPVTTNPSQPGVWG